MLLAAVLAGQNLLPQPTLAQGTVNFVNTATTLVHTNTTGLGGTAGNTATMPNGFYYALFIAPSTITSHTANLQEVVNPTPWSFTGIYATNTSLAGRLNGGSPVPVPSWPPGQTNSYMVVGWSASLGTTWSQVAAQLYDAGLNNCVWTGPNWSVTNAFLGASIVASGAAGGGGGPFPPPPLNLFGGSGLPGFDLCVVGPTPPPVADFTANPTFGQAPLTVQFTDQSTGAIAGWDWDFGDGSAHSSTPGALHTYVRPGSFTVTLTVANSAGATSKSGPITVSASPLFVPSGPGSALLFNGTNSYVSIATTGSLTGTFTIEIWANPNDPTNALALAGSRSPGEYSFDFKFWKGNLIHGDIGNGAFPWITITADATFPYSTGVWYHAAYVVTPTNYTIYANGFPVATSNYPASNPILYDANHQLVIGNFAATGYEYFNGQIDEVRIWNTARSAFDIEANLNSSLSGSEPGLVGYWRFDEGSGTTTADSSGRGFTGTLIGGPVWVSSTAPVGTPLAAYTFSTLAGYPGYGNSDGVGSAAQFNRPSGITIDTNGNLYVSDTDNDTVRKVTPAGVVTTIAGFPGAIGSADGTNRAARFWFNWGLASDIGGNVYVADTVNNTIRKMTPSGTNWIVSTIAGLAGSAGNSNGIGSNARFSQPYGIAVDLATNLYVADTFNYTVRKIAPIGTNWVVSTFAGSAGVFGTNDGVGSAALFDYPVGIAVDASANVFVTDYLNCTIREISPAGVVTTIAGLAGVPGSADGTNSSARFDLPCSAAVDSSGNIYVGDCSNSTIRKITMVIQGQGSHKQTNWVVTTLAGLAGMPGSANGTGTNALFDHPLGLVPDKSGNLFVADERNCTIRKITSAAVVSTLAG